MKLCDCGQQLSDGALQCPPCARAAFKKLAKYAILAGSVLGLVCSSVPPEYQAACKALATALGAC